MAKKYKATFLKREKWWIGWSDDVPGALTQGKSLKEVRENLKNAIALMLEDVDVDNVPDKSVRLVREDIEV